MRLRFDARTRAILARLPVVNVYSLAELLLLAALAVQLARLTWTIVTPIAPLGAWQPLPPAVPADPLGVFAAFDPFDTGVAAAPAAATAGISISVFGTRLDVAAGRGSAILAGPDGVQRSVAVGEEVVPGVTLKAVAFDHVTLDRGGVPQDLYLNPADAPAGGQVAAGAPAPAAGSATGTVSAGDLQADISAIPRIDGGRVSGMALRGNGKGFFEAAGLRDGDVVTAIGGRPVTGPQDVAQFAGTVGPLSLTVERGGQETPLTIQVTK